MSRSRSTAHGGSLVEPNRNHALASAFKLALRRRNLAQLTIERRFRLLRLLGRDHDMLTISADELDDWLHARKVVARSRNAYLADFKSFFDWLQRREHRPDNPADELERSRVPRLLPRPIPEQDLQRAIEVARPRMRLWLSLAAYTGLRCCEIASLAAEDLVWHHDPPMILVRSGKGGHQRMVTMSEHVEQALRETDLPRAGYLFRHAGSSGEHVTAQSVSQLIGKYLRSLGIAASAHMLRHYFGTRAYEETDLRVTQELMGHVSPTTTAIYAAWSPSKAATAVRTFGPR